MRRALLLAPLFSWLACSAEGQPLRIDLGGDWRIETRADDARFAQPEFDDRGWATYRLPRPASQPGSPGVPPGVYWLRKTVAVPAAFQASTPLVLTLGTLHDAYEVFVNGSRVGSTYDPGDVWSVRTARPRAFTLTAPLGQRATIAIRASGDNLTSRIGAVGISINLRPDDGPYLLTGVDNSPPALEAVAQLRRVHTLTPVLIEFAAEGLMAFIVFLLT